MPINFTIPPPSTGGGGGGTVTGTGAAGQIAFWASGSGLDGDATLSWDGTNFGIGTGSPASALDVRKTVAGDLVRIQNNDASGFSSIIAHDNGGTGKVGLGYGNASTTAGYAQKGYLVTASGVDFNFFVGAPSSPMATFKSSGDVALGTAGGNTGLYVDVTNKRVGVNTAAPQSPVDLRADVSADLVRVQNNNSAGYSSIVAYDSGGAGKVGIGWGNSGAAADYASRGYIVTAGGVDFGFIIGGAVRGLWKESGELGVGTASPTSTLHVDGSVAAKARTVTGASSTAAAERTILVNNGATAHTVALPAAATCPGREYAIKRLGTNTVTIDPNGAETIDGAATLDLTTQYQTARVVSDGANWHVV